MKKTTLALTLFLASGAFVAGVAVGKTPAKPMTFTSTEELKWDDLGGPKMATISGDYKKGPYLGLLKIPAGFTSPMHTHSGDYTAVQVQGSSTHWAEGEDGKSAKKMTPGSTWSVPAKVPHVSSCAAGADCIILLSQKTKFDYKDVSAAAGSAAGSAAKPAGAGSAAKPATPAGGGSAAKPATPAAGSAATKK